MTNCANKLLLAVSKQRSRDSSAAKIWRAAVEDIATRRELAESLLATWEGCVVLALHTPIAVGSKRALLPIDKQESSGERYKGSRSRLLYCCGSDANGPNIPIGGK